MNKMTNTFWVSIVLTLLSFMFIGYSIHFGFEDGIAMGHYYWSYMQFVLSVMPCVFLLIALFNQWIERELIMKYMGKSSGKRAYVLAIILASSTVGGIFVVLPVAHALYKKGARLSIVLTYLNCACVCRVPMTLWEISMLGLKFTSIRYLVSIPLIIMSSVFTEKFVLNDHQFERSMS